ncbi:hypothetical protein GFS03_02255 [Sulfolobus sp. E5-1-F]|uniref:hypothetical protein n=1 Tax=Sulfolobaceae TaxID=118883 RepID=UPI001294DDBB|nr:MULTISPECIES: hypothetical protein [unclassified Sulfolobus]QGA53492.1 hypothetical protein GFS03_02255 [Sulfolobus sp. E5-1-F]QGA68838.1 hypothetical protein GFS33_08970 [Sulfolobus sp. E11-6]
MFLLQQSEDGTSIRKLVKFLNINFPQTDLIVYGRGLELPAFTFARALSSLKNKIINILNIYDFLFIYNPYVEVSNVVVFTADESELRELLDSLESLRIKGNIYYCGKSEIKPRYNFISIINLDRTFCEINLSLSILKILCNDNTIREKRILDQLNDLSDLDDYVKNYAKVFKPDLPIFLSPIMFPAKSFLESLGVNVSSYFDTKILDGAQIVYTGVDMHIIRRMIFSLKSKGVMVTDVLIDADPLLAPIYLSMIMFYLKKK